MELFVSVQGAQHTGDLEKARADLRAAGASILSDSANYQTEVLNFLVQVDGDVAFRKRFETMESYSRSSIQRAT